MSKKSKHVSTPYWYKHWSQQPRGISNQHTSWVKVRLMKGQDLGQHPSYASLKHWYATCMINGEHITLTAGHATEPEVWAAMEHLANRVEPNKWKLRGTLPHCYENIVIEWPKPGYNRYKIANEIQNTCNTSGVARELVKVIADVMHNGGDVKTVSEDAAVVAIVDKLQSLMRLDAFKAHSICSERSSIGTPVT